MLNGVARKIALPFVLLSAVGWVTFAVGFGINNFQLEDDTGTPATGLQYFQFWCFGVSAILLYAVTITHLFCGNPVTIFLIMFFQCFFFTSGGAVLYGNGDIIRQMWDDGDQGTLHRDNYSVVIEFTGVSVAIFLYWVSLLFWPCFRKKDDYEDA